MVRSVDVAVVGAGPAGLVLALLLARSGRSTVVAEQNASFEREYRGEGIQPGTRRIFADLGLGDQIDALDCGAPRGVVARIDGREATLEFAALLSDPDARPIFLPQPALLAVLAGAASAAGATIELATTFRALRYDGGRVAGIEAVARSGATVSIDARLVVACDGRFSAVRRAAGFGLRATRVPYDVLWFSAQAPSAANDTVYVQVDGPHLALAFPSRRRMIQVGWLLAKGTGRPSRAELVTRAPREAADALAREPVLEPTLLPVASEATTAWSAPGLLLIGDAAHPMSPVAAQGINVAVADAVVAARHIARALDERKLDPALRAIESERAPAVARIARQQNALLNALYRFGPGRSLGVALAAVSLANRTGLFAILGLPLLDRFLWGDPPVRAERGPWNEGAKDSPTTSR